MPQKEIYFSYWYKLASGQFEWAEELNSEMGVRTWRANNLSFFDDKKPSRVSLKISLLGPLLRVLGWLVERWIILLQEFVLKFSLKISQWKDDELDMKKFCSFVLVTGIFADRFFWVYCEMPFCSVLQRI